MQKIVIIIALSLLAAGAYISFFGTLWFLVGALWGLVNLYFIKQLLYSLLIENPKNLPKIALFVLIKFPVLYGAGFGLLYYQSDFLWEFVAGFSVLLVLSTQRRWGISLT